MCDISPPILFLADDEKKYFIQHLFKFFPKKMLNAQSFSVSRAAPAHSLDLLSQFHLQNEFSVIKGKKLRYRPQKLAMGMGNPSQSDLLFLTYHHITILPLNNPQANISPRDESDAAFQSPPIFGDFPSSPLFFPFFPMISQLQLFPITKYEMYDAK